jgi:hypothetical protein
MNSLCHSPCLLDSDDKNIDINNVTSVDPGSESKLSDHDRAIDQGGDGFSDDIENTLMRDNGRDNDGSSGNGNTTYDGISSTFSGAPQTGGNGIIGDTPFPFDNGRPQFNTATTADVTLSSTPLTTASTSTVDMTRPFGRFLLTNSRLRVLYPKILWDM